MAPIIEPWGDISDWKGAIHNDRTSTKRARLPGRGRGEDLLRGGGPGTPARTHTRGGCRLHDVGRADWAVLTALPGHTLRPPRLWAHDHRGRGLFQPPGPVRAAEAPGRGED